MDRDTGEYSSTKAPETRKRAEEREAEVDSRLIPGGAEPRTPTQQGMAGLDRETASNFAEDSGQTRYRDTGREEVKSGAGDDGPITGD
jgi:hypothetical protein